MYILRPCFISGLFMRVRPQSWVGFHLYKRRGVHGPGEYYLCVQKYISNAAVYIDRFFSQCL